MKVNMYQVVWNVQRETCILYLTYCMDIYAFIFLSRELVV